MDSQSTNLDADHRCADAEQKCGAAKPCMHWDQLLPPLTADAICQERQPDQVLRLAAHMHSAYGRAHAHDSLHRLWQGSSDALTCAVANVIVEMPSQLCVPARV